MDYLLCWSDFLKEIFQLVQLMGNIAGGHFKFVSFFFVMAWTNSLIGYVSF
jgi:hypothetical protein